MNKRPLIAGIIAADVLLVFFVVLVTSISGWTTTRSQFTTYWYYLVPLAVGFGVQIGLYVYLRETLKQAMSKKLMTMTGSTSTGAMISCCAHYLANILPILGVSGIATFVGQFQVQIFWVGLLMNGLGIAVIARRVANVRKHLGVQGAPFRQRLQAVRPLIDNRVVIGAFALILLAVWVSGGSSQTTVTAGAEEQTPTAAQAGTALTRINSEGGMTVAVTPEKASDGSWGFSVTIDNHVQNVTQDMVAVSSLTDATGNVVSPQAWEGDPPGGHHRKGVLTFGQLPNSPVSLTINDLGGIASRTFTWDNLHS